MGTLLSSFRSPLMLSLQLLLHSRTVRICCAAVIVAGTGSACRLLKADSSVHGVGGWGHQIGDGGSAFWIARRLIQCIFDEEDGLHPSPHPISKTKRLFLEFFDLSDKAGILDILYTNFDKSRIASFAAHVAKEANDDPLVRLVFRDAGEQLGLHVRAVSRNFDEEMLHNARLLLIGSVWRSWELLKDGKIAIRLIRRLDLFYLYSKETFK
ncbi:hypothetical protein WUBG_17325 [Wuchereria bancrofti]|uniref:N-acetyl-D-glucosamine kinase n=1 Tax=Wuchereria bancrofti TaxID=6293 RepID=J9DQ46_WUCBA|nr:hypothetical protein WUBG_17325 [Wuchereria bancrofti]